MVVGRFQNVQQATTVQNMRQPVPRLQVISLAKIASCLVVQIV